MFFLTLCLQSTCPFPSPYALTLMYLFYILIPLHICLERCSIIMGVFSLHNGICSFFYSMLCCLRCTHVCCRYILSVISKSYIEFHICIYSILFFSILPVMESKVSLSPLLHRHHSKHSHRSIKSIIQI